MAGAHSIVHLGLVSLRGGVCCMLCANLSLLCWEVVDKWQARMNSLLPAWRCCLYRCCVGWRCMPCMHVCRGAAL